MPPAEQQELQADQQVNALALKRGLPMSIEAEMFVIGLVLVDDGLFPQVGGALDIDDFAIEKHRRIFRCMKALNDRGDHIEYLTLANELDKFQQLENVGGIAYLASLTEGMPKLSHLADYIKIIKHKSILRKLHLTAQEISASCVQGRAGGRRDPRRRRIVGHEGRDRASAIGIGESERRRSRDSREASTRSSIRAGGPRG